MSRKDTINITAKRQCLNVEFVSREGARYTLPYAASHVYFWPGDEILFQSSEAEALIQGERLQWVYTCLQQRILPALYESGGHSDKPEESPEEYRYRASGRPEGTPETWPEITAIRVKERA